MNLTHKCRFYPNKKQEEKMRHILELCRQLYNAALEQRRYDIRSRVRLTYVDQASQLPELKEAYPEFRKVYSQVPQDVLRCLDRAFENFFDRPERRWEHSPRRF